ncbi:MAG TPA: hypothetical protein VI306_08090 [Pyrinomonadaceae bacterium]
MDADKASQQKPSVFFALILGGILVASYFLGMAYLIVNLVLFGFSALGSISQSARNNALEHIMTIAIILDRWRSENPSECDEWIKQTWSLGPIYEAVQKAR